MAGFLKQLEEEFGNFHADRRVKFRPLSAAWSFWVFPILVVVFVLGLAVASQDLVLSLFARSQGIPAIAQVTGMSVGHIRYSDTYNLALVYPISDSRQESTQESVPLWFYDTLHTGQSIPVHYLKSHPLALSLDGDTDQDSTNLWDCVVVLLIIVAFPYFQAVKFRKQYFLFKNGALVKGRVISSVTPGPYRLVTVSFEFKNQTYSADISAGGLKTEKGEEVLVLLDPEDPNKNLVFRDNGSSLFKVESSR